jgi:peptide/nickel transport system substrate-binding protein
LTRQAGVLRRFVTATAVVSFLAFSALVAACRTNQQTAATTSNGSKNVPQRGGTLVASIRTEPGSFNRYAKRDSGTELVSILTQAKLVRINKATQVVEPYLADSWTTSPDGRNATLKLHPGVTFSDGHPFTADDVAFAFQAVYDERTAGTLGDSLRIEGKPLRVTAVDATTVSIVFPAPYAPGVRILDNLPIYPLHKLGAALASGTINDAWGLSTPPTELTGLGPFVVAQYLPGQRLVFERNPRYFRQNASGMAMPYLDRLTVDITPDSNAEILKLEAGQIDAMTVEVAPESYAAIKRAADGGKVKLIDLGVGYNADALWFNLKPGAFAGDPRAAWLQRDELRKAISLAVDRKLFANTVFLGAAEPVYGPETPANKQWYWHGASPTPHDPSTARRMLASIGLTDRNGDGMLEDANGRAARFTLLVQKGRPNLERAGVVIRDELKKVGVLVDVVSLEGLALIERFARTRQYEAVYFTVSKTDTDPAVNLDFWSSRGSAHIWNFNQDSPATDWEKRIDALVVRQIAALDPAERKRLYDQMQEIFAEHLPMVYFAAPRIYVASSSRVINVTPALMRPQLLWAPEMVAVVH